MAADPVAEPAVALPFVAAPASASEPRIAPSAELRTWYHADPAARWPEFRRRYTEELRNSQAVRDFVREIADAGTVTLLYASKNAAENHALVLQEYLQRAAEEAADKRTSGASLR